jgi:hypothetical protein
MSFWQGFEGAPEGFVSLSLLLAAKATQIRDSPSAEAGYASCFGVHEAEKYT